MKATEEKLATIPSTEGNRKNRANERLTWDYELNLWRNPSALITIAKCMIAAAFVPAILVFWVSGCERGIRHGAQAALPVVGIVLPIMLILILIAYPIYALANGGCYRVHFVMDESGIDHIQQERDFKRQKKLGVWVLLLGFATRQYGAGAAGLLGTAKQSHYTHFKKVKKIRTVRKRNVIYLDTMAGRNQVYVSDPDFDAVLEQMINNCPPKITLKRG